MLALMNNAQYHYDVRNPTSLHQNPIDTKLEQSGHNSPERSPLISGKSNVYTTLSVSNTVPFTTNHPDFERWGQFVDSLPKNGLTNNNVANPGTIDLSDSAVKIQSSDVELMAKPELISLQGNIKPKLVHQKRVQAKPVIASNISLITATEPVSEKDIQETPDVSPVVATNEQPRQPTTSMDPELRNILRNVSVDKVREHTHISLYAPHARWTIPNQNLTTFWTGYCDLVQQSNLNLCMAERPQEIMPLISKLTFKFNSESNKDDPSFTKIIQWVCHIYQTVITEYFHLTTDTNVELAAVILQSSDYWYTQDRESGQSFIMMEVRIQFPHAHIDSGMQNRIIRPRVIQLLRNNNILQKMAVQPIGDWDQIISSNVLDYPVTMYGSSEEPKKPKLILKHIWFQISREMLDTDTQLEEFSLEDAFDPRNHSHYMDRLIDPTIFEGKSLEYWLPIFLSLGYWSKSKQIQPKDEVQDGGRFKTQNKLIAGEKIEINKKPLSLKIISPNDSFDQMVQFIIQHKIPTLGGHWLTYGKLRQAFTYIYSTQNVEFPYKSPQKFNEALKSYEPWKQYLFDQGSSKEKIRISFDKAFMDQVNEFAKNNYKVEKPCKIGIDRDLWNSLPTGTDIPMTRINYYDGPEIHTLRPHSELIGSRDRSCIVYIAAPGIGKTENINAHLVQLPSNIPILCPSFRVALSEKQNADFNRLQLGASHYHDEDLRTKLIIRMDEIGRLIIQIDSICRVIGPIDNGYLIIDEIESLIEHIFSSAFIRDRSKIIKRLTDYIMSARHVIIADANASMSTILFLEQICHRETLIYKSDYIRNPKQAYFVPGKGALTECIVKDINTNYKLYIPTNSNNYAKLLFNILQSRCPGKRGKLYNKDTTIAKDKDKKPIDPVSDFINYDYVIVTPKFQAGNSFTLKHFTREYCYFSGASCSPAASSQLMMRVRNFEDDNVYIYIDNRLGGSKTALHDVDAFEQMRDKVVRQSAARSSTHNFVLSNQEIASIDMDIYGQINMNDPATFLMVGHKFNVNKGYKNYTHRTISILKGMGFTYGGNLATGSEEEKLLEQKYNKDAIKHKQETELNEARSFVSVGNINDDQATEIKCKLDVINKGNHDIVVTEEEKLSLKKYNLFKTVKLLYPESPEDIVAAKKIKRPKELINKLIETARIDSPQDELHTLEGCLMELANVTALEPGVPKIERRFYELEAMQKSVMIGYLLSCLRVLGFRGFFDPLPITVNKDALVRYLTENRQKIEDITQVGFTTSQLTPNGVIKWLNSKLDPLLSIRIRSVNNDVKYRRYILESPWRLDLSGHQPKVLHYPLETETLFETYFESYPTIIIELINKLPAKQIPDSFDRCYYLDPNYPGAIVINDIPTWNKHINQNKDPLFQQRASELYQQYMLYQNYHNYITKNIEAGHSIILWNDYIAQINSTKILTFNITR